MKRLLALTVHALGAAARRGGRNASIALALAVVVSALGSVLLLSESIRAFHREVVAHAPGLTLGRLVAGRPALVPIDFAEGLRGELGVRRLRPRVWGWLYLEALEGNVLVAALDEATREALELPATLETGGAVVGPRVARTLGLRLGDRVAFGTSEGPRVFRVGALLDRETALLADDVVLLPEAEARLLLEIPAGFATDIAVDVFPPEELGAVATLAAERLPSARVIDRDSVARLYELTFDARSGFLAAALVPSLLALLLIAWERLTGLSRTERQEIGVLKAIGWSTGDVLVVRMIESGLVALVGTLVGVVVAYLHVYFFGAALLVPMLLGWSAHTPELAWVPALDVPTLLLLVASVVAPFVALSLLPAFRAAMLDPDTALREEGA